MLVKAPGIEVVGRDQQTDPVAIGDPAEAGHDMSHAGPTEATTLHAVIDGEPAKPPAGAIPEIRMQHIKADHPLVALYDMHRVRRTSADRSGDAVQGAEKAFDLVRVEFDGGDHAKVSMANPIIDQGLRRPDKGHETLRTKGRKGPLKALPERPGRLRFRRARGSQPRKFPFP